MSIAELIRSYPGTIFYWLWKTNPARRGQEYHSMSQVGARVNRYRQVLTEAETE